MILDDRKEAEKSAGATCRLDEWPMVRRRRLADFWD